VSNRPAIGLRGLNNSDNPLSLPPGTLTRADNVLFRNNNTVEPMPGENYYLDPHADQVLNLFTRWGGNDAPILHLDNDTLVTATGAAFAGAFTEVLAQRVRMKFAEARKNLYFTALEGVHFLYDSAQDPVLAGVPRAPDLDFVNSELTGNPDAGWMEADSQVAARSLFGIKDGNGNLKLGAPSGRLVITNPANQTLVAGALVRTGGNTVTVALPAGHGYRVGDIFVLTLAPVDANFANGNKTIVTVGSTSVTYTEAGANVASANGGNISSGAKNVLWRINLPPDVTTSHFFRLYRGATSATAASPPNDEMFLVFEGKIAAGDITAGYVDYTDRTPESVLGLFGSEPLYTNANSGDGALAARFRPPRAVDLVWWDNRMWYANTIDVGRRTLTLLGVGSPDGLQDGDSVNVDTSTEVQLLVARTTPAAPNEFKLYTDGSASQNIERTARALVAAFNIVHTTARAYYASGADDAPGEIELETTAIGETLFVSASRLTAWSPALPVGVSEEDQLNDERTNGLSFSEAGLPDAVPPLNYLQVGAEHVEVVRILPMRDKLLAMTSNGGFWTVSGPAPYRVEPLDLDVDLRHPDTAVRHSGMVYAYSTHGVVAVSESGVRILSGPLEEPLRDFDLDVGAAWASYSRAFAFSRESLHEYHLFLPDSSSPACPEAYILNSSSEFWSHRTGSRTCAMEHPNGAAFYGDGDEDVLLKERTSPSDVAYRAAHKSFTRALVAKDETLVTLASVTGIEVGDMLTQIIGFGSGVERTVVEEVLTSTNQVRTAITIDWELPGAVVVHKAIPVSIQLAPDTGGQPGLEKQVRDVVLHFKRLNTHQQDIPNNKEPGHVNVTFSTEKHFDEEPVVRIDRGGWGLQPYGTSPWGDPNGPADERVAVPQDFQKARQLRVGFTALQAGCTWELCGYSLESEVVSERSR
jgi:hypothetical protein